MEILEAVSHGIPPWAQYRINVERIYSYRLKCAQSVSDIIELEQTIRNGQIEELLRQVRPPTPTTPARALGDRYHRSTP